ncbi:deoxyuridine 5'-triphosphate nucleotidohydrolase [Paenibacillus faecis]|uniref:dUTP diphosphatase n=1 Tax=Paenibacillus faecis TaxID=862114 RepID=UPI001B15F0EC|nr:dUTP diphosphatase [Paenibacillus faecis]GIO83506.1 deoxyuridine 5'-triphosphate nucleotidohydrolase [Paenibacillus faecis]
MQVKVKKLHPDAQIPVYAKPGDSGFDLCALKTKQVKPYQSVVIPTGLSFEIPEGYELQIRPRSGVTTKTDLRVQLGTVDSGYRGDVGIIVDNIGVEDIKIPAGFRLAQGVVCPVQRVELIESDDLSPTERDSGGFGHTGV